MTEFESPSERRGVTGKDAEKAFDTFILAGRRREMHLRADALRDRTVWTRAHEAVTAPTSYSNNLDDPESQLTKIEESVREKKNDPKTGIVYTTAYENAAGVVDSWIRCKTDQKGMRVGDPFNALFLQLDYVGNKSGRWNRTLTQVLRKTIE